MTDPKEHTVAALMYRVEKSGSGCLSTTLLLVGGFGSLAGIAFCPLWIITLPMLAYGFTIDTKKRRIYFCGNCGNDVQPTSRLCPHCRMEIVDE